MMLGLPRYHSLFAPKHHYSKSKSQRVQHCRTRNDRYVQRQLQESFRHHSKRQYCRTRLHGFLHTNFVPFVAKILQPNCKLERVLIGRHCVRDMEHQQQQLSHQSLWKALYRTHRSRSQLKDCFPFAPNLRSVHPIQTFEPDHGYHRIYESQSRVLNHLHLSRQNQPGD